MKLHNMQFLEREEVNQTEQTIMLIRDTNLLFTHKACVFQLLYMYMYITLSVVCLCDNAGLVSFISWVGKCVSTMYYVYKPSLTLLCYPYILHSHLLEYILPSVCILIIKMAPSVIQISWKKLTIVSHFFI